jgi:hypothetical protein
MIVLIALVVNANISESPTEEDFDRRKTQCLFRDVPVQRDYFLHYYYGMRGY